MKETKVYVDELPKSCKTCQFQCYGECRNGCDILKTDYSMTQCHIMRGKYKDCPLIDIKTHDRELVEKVCEKIKEKTFGLWYFVLNEQIEHFEGNRYVLSQKDFNDILDQIQKEAENE